MSFHNAMQALTTPLNRPPTPGYIAAVGHPCGKPSKKTVPYDGREASQSPPLVRRKCRQHRPKSVKVSCTIGPWTNRQHPPTISKPPALSQPYDQTVAIRSTLTMAVRSACRNICDAAFAESTLRKKSVTGRPVISRGWHVSRLFHFPD
jgi:hypothetical protein